MIEITPLQARILGSLIEKEITTPDQYPLSLNSLILACNQKSNRDPVMDLAAEDVQAVIDELIKHNLVAEVVFGSRVPKYKHRFCNTEFSQLHFDSKSLAILCVLFLRGPQTPGELRTRAGRLYQFKDVEVVDEALEKLIKASPTAYVEKLAREPGKRESRFRHLFFGEEELAKLQTTAMAGNSEVTSATRSASPLSSRVESLESEVMELKAELHALRQAWDDFNS